MKIASILVISAAFVLLNVSSALAGRLDVAVIQFVGPTDPAEIEAALARVDLFEVTDSDKLETSERALKGGRVLFAQSVGTAPGGSFSSSTRISNERADVKGSLSGNTASVQIVIQEGVDVGLRKFRRLEYSGTGSVAGNVPRVIGIKTSSGKTQSVIKGQSKITSYDYTTLIAAQYRP